MKKRHLIDCVFIVGIVVAVNSAAVLGGVTVGSSSLILALDYSDTFTWTEYGGIPDRALGYPLSTVDSPADGTPGEGLAVENCYGNAARSWPDSKFSLVTDTTTSSSSTDVYPGSNGSGSDTGMSQTGYSSGDWGFEYGLRDNFVIQFDAVQTQDRIDISIGGTPGTIHNESAFTIFVRPDDRTYQANSAIGLYNSTIGEKDSGLSTSVPTDGEWHNYAAHYDLSNRSIEVFVDEQSLGIIDVDTVAGGAFSGLQLSASCFNIGFGGPDRVWMDNVQVGGVSIQIPGDANNDGIVDSIDASALAANWQTEGGATWSQGDFNGDGNVDDLDATILATNWQGSTPPPSSVPEPSALLLIIVSVFFISIRRQVG